MGTAQVLNVSVRSLNGDVILTVSTVYIPFRLKNTGYLMA